MVSSAKFHSNRHHWPQTRATVVLGDSIPDGPNTYKETVKFLDALLEGVPDSQHLEIRTLKAGGGAKKNFYSLARLRRRGFAAALPGHLDGKENVYYGVAPRYEALEKELEQLLSRQKQIVQAIRQVQGWADRVDGELDDLALIYRDELLFGIGEPKWKRRPEEAGEYIPESRSLGPGRN